MEFKGIPGHFIFEFNVGKSRIWHTTKLKLNDEFLDRFQFDCRWRHFKFRVVLSRIRLFPTMISKIKWSELPLILFLFSNLVKNVIKLSWTTLKRFLLVFLRLYFENCVFQERNCGKSRIKWIFPVYKSVFFRYQIGIFNLASVKSFQFFIFTDD